MENKRKESQEKDGKSYLESLLKPKRESTVSKLTSDDALFDELIAEIGNDNKFQSRFNFLYNFILVFLVTMPYLNIVLAMTIPDHWCFVEGQGNMTTEEWKEKTLPKEVDPKTLVESFSSCQMYNQSQVPVPCEDGYEYDRQWYTETVASQQDWVCEDGLYVTNTFVVGRIGEIIGTFVFGQLGDLIGRRPVFYVSLVLLVTGRVSSAFASNSVTWFLVTILIGSTATTSVFQSPFVICMEVSASNKRAHIAFMQCLGWVLGMCALPLVAWLVKDWAILMVVTTLPVTVYFLTFKLLPESPRWLASRGKVIKSLKTLEYIASVNGTKVPSNALQVLQKIADKKEKIYGIPSLFSNSRLAKNSLIIILCWIICGFSYYVLVLNVSNTAGNPFLNFFIQSLVELPGYMFGRVLSEKLGRRWTQTGSYLCASLSCILVIAVHNVGWFWLTIVFISCIKLCVTMSFYMVWLQAMEIYPTCVRQTGTSIGGLVANMFGILGPYVVLLGTTVDARLPYFILLAMTLLGAVGSSFLPETYNKKLPETLADAHNFGREQKYWSFSLK